MALPIWPEELPQCPLLDGYTESPLAGAVVSTNMSMGPRKTRRRYTDINTASSFDMILDADQVTVFMGFLNNEIAFGALPFEIQDYSNIRAPVKVRIIGDPPYTLEAIPSAGKARVKMTLEVFSD